MGFWVAPNVAGLKLSVEPTGVSLDAMTENFALQRDKEFASHGCADSTKEVEH